MSDAIFDRHIDHPAAWRAADLGGKDGIAFDLGPAHMAAFDEALEGVRARGLDRDGIGKEDFPLPAIAGDIARLHDELMNGRGIAVVRGFPVSRYGQDDMATIYWGLGCHLGRGVSQSPMGDRLGHVTDVSGRDPRERGYRSSKELDLHTDSDDIVGLLCLQNARSGGRSRFASSLAVHNEIRAHHPEFLAPLYRGFRYHWRGEEPEGEPPVTSYRVPVFSVAGGAVSCCYLRSFIDMAAAEIEEPLSALETAALDCFEAVANRNDILFETDLEPGEAVLFNNLTVLHARTAYVDHDEPARRRHLLRLWLSAYEGRPMAAPLRRYYGSDGIAPRGAADTLYTGASLVD